jgi:hypothetical protein
MRRMLKLGLGVLGLAAVCLAVPTRQAHAGSHPAYIGQSGVCHTPCPTDCPCTVLDPIIIEET